MRHLAAIMVTALGLLVVAAAASAQQYPIDAEAVVQNFGVQRVGETFQTRDCGFQPGTTAAIRLNDTGAGSAQVGSDGCVRLTVRIVDQDTVSIDSREYAARRCANNTIIVTAQVAGGATEQRQVQNRFTIVCAAAAGTVPRTGSDIADLAALGGVLVAAGATLVTIVRRRRRPAAGTAGA